MKRWITDWIETRLRPWLLDRLKAVTREDHEELRATLFSTFRRNDDLAEKLRAAEESLVALADQYRAEQKAFERDPGAAERATWLPSMCAKAEVDETLDHYRLTMTAGVRRTQVFMFAPSDLRFMETTVLARAWTRQIAEGIRRQLFVEVLHQIAKLKGEVHDQSHDPF